MDNVILLILIAAIAGGSVAPFAKISLEVFQPFTLVLIRFLSASLVMLPFVYRNRELTLSALKKVLLVAAIGSLNPILLFIALQFTPSSVSPLIYAAVPLMTALYLQRFKQVKITSNKLLGIITGFAGVAIIILLPFFQKGSLDLQGFGGNVLIFGAAVAFMFYGIISKDKQAQYHISPLALTFYLAVVTVVVCIPFAAGELINRPVDLVSVQPRHIFASLEIGVLGTTAFYISYQKALQLGNELTASLFAYLQPIATILFAVLLLGEEITIPFIVGGTLAVIGAGMANAKNKPVVGASQ
jgi:drug/metabolite transporter (DMT)-like permease